MKYRDYIIKRLLLLFPVIFGVSVFTFAISITVTDPVYSYLGGGAQKVSPQQREAIRILLGLNQPWYIQYEKYVERIFFHFDWGRSTAFGNTTVLKLLSQRFPATVELAISALLIAVGIGIPLGIISAIRQDRPADHVSRIFALVGVSMPVFWFGIMLQVFLVGINNAFPFLPTFPIHDRYNYVLYNPPTRILFGILPATGFLTIDSLLSFQFNFFVDVIMHLFPPALVLSIILMAILSRMTRMSMIEVMRQDYILLAKSKGLKERVIIYRHAFRNALLPTLTIAGLLLAGLLTGAVLTEDVFAWPGIGSVAAAAITRLDINSLQGFVILTAILYVLSNLVIDLLYGYIDPRIRFD